MSDGDTPCKFTVLSTPDGDAQDTANLIHQHIDRCTHAAGDDPEPRRSSTPARLQAATAQLRRAEQLTSAVESLVRQQAHRDRCDELLEQAQHATTAASALFHEAEAEDLKADAARDDAHELVESAGLSTNPFPPDDIEVVASPAQAAIDAAAVTLGAANDSDALTLAERIEAVQVRLDRCRYQISDQ